MADIHSSHQENNRPGTHCDSDGGKHGRQTIETIKEQGDWNKKHKSTNAHTQTYMNV